MPVMDPVGHKATQIKLEVRDPKTPSTGANGSRRSRRRSTGPTKPSGTARQTRTALRWTPRRACGSRRGYGQTRRRHTVARDRRTLRPRRSRSTRAAVRWPCTTRKRRRSRPLIPVFGTHHLNFAEDANDTLWFCGGGQVVGWFNTKLYDQTGDEQKAQGWTALVLDTNGNGKRDALRRARSAGRPDEGQTDQRAVLRRGARVRLTDRSGDRSPGSRAPSPVSCPVPIRRRQRWRSTTSSR